ncbi:hypothetical protein [Teredinibacter sp. KSP-S5-2]|uniref:hypothetical protein n=1 Tax=Teredinibacter sp. KSP-S5-2 TaxID=3034506 RepID=UPI002934C42B|nr:hypothetical protein [Teredinibacter sp. KSP-S5-2]WNO07934.1 hypothetical protein P5V12_13200 [Teredinibacter sp. KSP-S5-2]
MKYVLVIFLSLSGTTWGDSLKLSFNDSLPDLEISDSQHMGYSVPFIFWSALYSTYSVTINDIEFTAYTFCDLKNQLCESNSRHILFLETTSPDFMTPEGVTIGSEANQIQGNSTLGGECKILPSYWYACMSVKYENETTLFGNNVIRLIKSNHSF